MFPSSQQELRKSLLGLRDVLQAYETLKAKYDALHEAHAKQESAAARAPAADSSHTTVSDPGSSSHVPGSKAWQQLSRQAQEAMQAKQEAERDFFEAQRARNRAEQQVVEVRKALQQAEQVGWWGDGLCDAGVASDRSMPTALSLPL